MEANLYPNTAVLSKYAIAHQIGDYNGLFDVNPTLQAIFDIKEKGEAFFATGPGTFTRASVGSYWDFKGDMASAAIDEPRFGYDPLTGELLGLLVEGTRTNLFLNSAALSTQGITTTAQVYSVSFYGTGTITFSGAYVGVLEGTAQKERVSITFTPSAGTVTCTVSGTVNYANFEAGSFATSWIATTGTSATRAMDVPSIAGADFTSFYNQSMGAFYCRAKAISNSSPGSNHLIMLSDGTADNRYGLYTSDTRQYNFYLQKNGNPAVKILSPEDYNSNWVNLCISQSPLTNYTINGTYQGSLIASEITVDRIGIGNRSYAPFDVFNGYIARLVYFPAFLTETELSLLSK